MRKLTALLLTVILMSGTIAGCGAVNHAPAGGAGGQAAESGAGGQTVESTADGQAAESAAGGQAEAGTDGGAETEEAGESRTAIPGAELAAEEEILAEGSVFNIYCIGEDFRSRVQDYYPEYVASGEDSGTIGQTRVRWHVYSDAEEYRDVLDEMLESLPETGGEGGTSEQSASGQSVSDQNDSAQQADDRVDMFVVDEAYLRDYVESAYSLDVTAEIGITREELSDQFPYTQQMATDSEGRLKAVTWQATPGVFAYRRSIAREVLGTDDPAKVQEAVSDWDKFAETAEMAKENGYYMLSGYGDAYQVYADNVSSAWVEDDVLNVDPHLTEWAEQTREFTENGYTHGTEQWSDDWKADHTGDGEVFGFFYSSWGIRYTLQSKAEGDTGSGEEEEEDDDVTSASGDYAVCRGPEPCHYGGQWIIAAAGCDNIELAGSIMRTLTCDPQLMKKITEDIHEFTNTVSGMKEIAESGYKADVLGRQNPVPVYVEVAEELSQQYTTSYDEDLDLGFQVSMMDYITGKTTLEEALDLFKKTAIARYDELEAED